ncbi:TetR family transcriptional regulator [Streptomyces sp. SID7909]|uniref:TetR family transcriptional regulator n=1 Tax=Streptomyces sp. SID7909 TaxID=2706092 RepID=UPI0013BB9CEA|nr:TetR family transcriptional regulator [Streptomyces sp. SID7909]NEC09054.1 TetR family transcriptional regulator [Streptomyces sp. SID7909]
MTEDRRPAKKPPMRDVLAEAAFALFLERGFERTTVDDIVARAGVGRRSFFRYFPSKEDAVFPDHEGCLADMTAFLADADGTDPVATVCDGARLVLRMYAEKPEFSVQRYRLTREVPGLRTYELSVVRRYERTLAGYLERRWAGDPDAGPDFALRAEVIAASVVAAHNNGLRSWLRSGGKGDAGAEVDRALELVRAVWGGADARPVVPAPEPSQAPMAAPVASSVSDDEVIVMVARKGAPMWRVVQHIESALGTA